MDIVTVIAFVAMTAAYGYQVWCVYRLEKSVDSLNAALDQHCTDYTDHVARNNIDMDDMRYALGRHTISLNHLSDVTEAARLAKQNLTLEDLAGAAPAYKKQIANNKKIIKELMP